MKLVDAQHNDFTAIKKLYLLGALQDRAWSFGANDQIDKLLWTSINRAHASRSPRMIDATDYPIACAYSAHVLKSHNGATRGFAILSREHDSQLAKRLATNVTEIVCVSIDPVFRGKGHGYRMISDLVQMIGEATIIARCGPQSKTVISILQRQAFTIFSDLGDYLTLMHRKQ